MFLLVASCVTRPIPPLLICVCRFVISVVFAVTRLSRFVIALATFVTVEPPTLNVGLLIVPSVFTVEPPPITLAVDAATLYSCAPFTASRLDAFTAPAARLVIFVPFAPFSEIESFVDES